MAVTPKPGEWRRLKRGVATTRDGLTMTQEQRVKRHVARMENEVEETQETAVGAVEVKEAQVEDQNVRGRKRSRSEVTQTNLSWDVLEPLNKLQRRENSMAHVRIRMERAEEVAKRLKGVEKLNERLMNLLMQAGEREARLCDKLLEYVHCSQALQAPVMQLCADSMSTRDSFRERAVRELRGLGYNI